MDDIFKMLDKCILFKSFSAESIENMINSINYRVKSFNKGEVVALEGSNCSSIGIVIAGSVEVQKIYESGKTVTITKLEEAHIFGEVIIFSNQNEYPATIVSSSKTKILFISKENFLKLCNLNFMFLNNFMALLSNKVLMLNKKLKNVSFQTIRQKISNLILEEYAKQKKLTLNLKYSRKEMAEQLGIPRPSLSRELVHMKEEEILDFEKNKIKILDLTLLENSLF
jgi:CRP-like cAMP-binding protein